MFGMPMAQPGIDTQYGGGQVPPDESIDDTTAPSENALNGYVPRTAISTQLTNTLGNMPMRPQPSGLRNVAASIASLGAGAGAQGIAGGQPIGFSYNPDRAEKAYNDVNYGDYDNKMNDFQNQVKSLALGANEEDRANAGEVKRLYGEAKNDVDQQKVAVAQQRADSYQYAQEVKEKAETDKHESYMEKLKNDVAKADKAFAVANENLRIKGKTADNLNAYHMAQLAQVNARHATVVADLEFKHEQSKRRNDAYIERQRILNAGSPGSPKTTTTEMEYNAAGQGTKKTVKSGPTQNLVPVYDKDGNPGFVPADKVDEFIRDHGGSRQ